MSSGRMTFRFEGATDKPPGAAAGKPAAPGASRVTEWHTADWRPLEEKRGVDADVTPFRRGDGGWTGGEGEQRDEEQMQPGRLEQLRSPGRLEQPGHIGQLEQPQSSARHSSLQSSVRPWWEEEERGLEEPERVVTSETWEAWEQRSGEQSYADFDYGSPSVEAGYPPSGGGREAAGGGYRPRRPSWWRLPLLVAGAIGVGLMLGYAALSLLGGADAGGSSGAANPATGQAASGASAEAGRVAVQIAAQRYYLLQYGVFSSPAGAEQARQELARAGFAGVVDPSDGNRVYAGLSPDREQAKLLGDVLKNQGIELYVREEQLPAADTVRFGGEAATVSDYFSASGELLTKLSTLSAALLGGGSGETSAVSTLHLRWSEAAKALEAGLPDGAKSEAAAIDQTVNRAVAALGEYDKSKADGLLWEVQDSMLSMMAGEKRLLELLSGTAAASAQNP